MNQDHLELAKPAGITARFGAYLNRRNLVLLLVALVAIGLALNSSALTAIGISPLIIAFLPCMAMCALGMCKKGKDPAGCSKASNIEDSTKSE